MNVLTLKIPDELDAALRAASRNRGVPKSAVVREALEQSLGQQASQAGAAARWVVQWRGRFAAPPLTGRGKQTAMPRDKRLAHILAKHLRQNRHRRHAPAVVKIATSSRIAQSFPTRPNAAATSSRNPRSAINSRSGASIALHNIGTTLRVSASTSMC